MSNIDILKDLFNADYKINFTSSVFRELTFDNSNIVLWIEDNILNITSLKDYNIHNYNNKKNNILLYSIQDKDDIIEIYKICAFSYIFTKEEILNNLINFFENKLEKSR